jgi:hypothetical protein
MFAMPSSATPPPKKHPMNPPLKPRPIRRSCQGPRACRALRARSKRPLSRHSTQRTEQTKKANKRKPNFQGAARTFVMSSARVSSGASPCAPAASIASAASRRRMPCAAGKGGGPARARWEAAVFQLGLGGGPRGRRQGARARGLRRAAAPLAIAGALEVGRCRAGCTALLSTTRLAAPPRACFDSPLSPKAFPARPQAGRRRTPQESTARRGPHERPVKLSR